MNRIPIFDYLRALAIFGIVLCHFCYNFKTTIWLGDWCGCTFNSLFFSMSGLLLGMAWNKKGRPVYGLDFLRHRFTRLCMVYYPFLLLMFIFCVSVGGYNIEIKDVVMHVLYLPWFDKINGFGHLWFMTMICICYIAVVPVSRLKILMGGGKLGLYFIATITAVLLQIVVSSIGLPGSLFIYLILFIIMFDDAPNIVKWCSNKDIKWVGACVMVITTTLLCYYNDIHKANVTMEKLLGVSSAISCLCIAMAVFKNTKSCKIVDFIANISFEIYLVHHVFAFGRFSVMNITNSWIIGFLVLAAIGLIGGLVLNRISKLFSI